MNVFAREAWDEFRFGMRNGVIPIIYVVLTGYLLLTLGKADYLQKIGAVGIPRNAPSLVYLLTSGNSFFLLFAWAWIFAQPIIRDRNAHLHEVVLASPVPLRPLLAGRYCGALGVALVVGSSQIAGFLAAPLLEWIGAVPPGSVAAAPWAAFAWSTLLFTLPLSAGAGALYFIAALRTRGVGGAFAVGALLMTLWMVSMIVFKEGHLNQSIATIIDPSGYCETEHQVVDEWTPQQKTSALLELSPALLVNRLLWGGLPLLLLGAALRRIRREDLALERSPGKTTSADGSGGITNRDGPLPGPVGAIGTAGWWRATTSEALWQIRYVVSRRWLWWTLLGIALLGVAGGFMHVVQHAYGPFVPRPELVTPLLSKLFYVIILFMTTGMVGMAARRDDQDGIGEMLDAAPAPTHVRVIGRAAAAVTITVLLALLPAIGSILTTAIAAPGSLRLLQPIVHQLTVLAPALLEISACTILLHALIRRPGPAYAATMLAAFIMIVNHEAELVSYPPFQIGMPVQICISGISGLAPWLEKLALGDGFKLAVVVLLLSLATLLTRRGTDTGPRARWRNLRRHLSPGSAAVVATACLALALFSEQMHQRYVVEGGYETLEQQLASDAAWETRWAGEQSVFSTAGGRVQLDVDGPQRQLRGTWVLQSVRSTSGVLHAELPHGMQVTGARVQNREVVPLVEKDHLALPLNGCAEGECEVALSWSLPATGWDEGKQPAWLQASGGWLHAPEVMPRLGFDANRVLRTPYDRQRFGLAQEIRLPAWQASLPSGAAAPAGRWSWRVTVDHGGAERQVREGSTEGLLDFAMAWGTFLEQTEIDGLTLRHDRSRAAAAAAVAVDVAEMQAGVARRLGIRPALDGVAQWPRELGETTVSGGWLLLAEHPHWDAADRGVGRWVRRAAIAEALARRAVRDACDLREGEGSAWLNDGLPGAIGLLCVAETDGLEALAALLSRGADQVTQALAASSVPVGPLKSARTDGWAVDYAPLAAFGWVGSQNPRNLATLFEQVRKSGDIGTALAALTDPATTDRLLGPPNASDIHVAASKPRPQLSGERWQWQGGGWTTVSSVLTIHRYSIDKGRLLVLQDQKLPSNASTDLLYLDAWPSYEREAKDNLL